MQVYNLSSFSKTFLESVISLVVYMYTGSQVFSGVLQRKTIFFSKQDDTVTIVQESHEVLS